MKMIIREQKKERIKIKGVRMEIKTILRKIKAWFTDGVYYQEKIVEDFNKQLHYTVDFKRIKVKTLHEILNKK